MSKGNKKINNNPSKGKNDNNGATNAKTDANDNTKVDSKDNYQRHDPQNSK